MISDNLGVKAGETATEWKIQFNAWADLLEKKMAEAQKIAVRNARRDANKAVDVAEKAKTLSEDQAKDSKDRIQKMTKRSEDDVDVLVSTKSKEIEEV